MMYGQMMYGQMTAGSWACPRAPAGSAWAYATNSPWRSTRWSATASSRRGRHPDIGSSCGVAVEKYIYGVVCPGPSCYWGTTIEQAQAALGKLVLSSTGFQTLGKVQGQAVKLDAAQDLAAGTTVEKKEFAPLLQQRRAERVLVLTAFCLLDKTIQPSVPKVGLLVFLRSYSESHHGDGEGMDYSQHSGVVIV